PPDLAECEQLAELALGACDEQDLALRLYWTGRTLAVTAGLLDPELEALRARGLRLVSIPWSAGALASAKSTSYAENMAAQDAAVAAGADDALLVAVVHRGVALLGRREAHRLRQLRPVAAEVFELERLEVVLERLDEPRRRLDLAELALDGAVAGVEAPPATGADVHLLDGGVLAPPFGDEPWIGPDGEHVLARRVEDPLDPDLELARCGHGGLVHQLTACLTRSAIFFSSVFVSLVRAYDVGHIEP